MKAHTFNNYMPLINHTWAARVLGMQLGNHSGGPDLIGPDKNIELKFQLGANSGYKHLHWTVNEEQLSYENCYWGVGFYWMRKSVSQVRSVSPRSLEANVTNRELYLIKWDWMLQFPPFLSQGQTEKSSWERYLRSPKFNRVPPTVKTFEVEKGKIYFTEGVPVESFSLAA